MIRGEVGVLIKTAGERPRRTGRAVHLLGTAQRLRPGFPVRPLLADDLLAALVRVPDFFGR